MEFKKTVTNPMLVGAMEVLRAEDTPEHREMFLEEVLKAVFLMPAVVTPTPEIGPDGEVKLSPDSRIQFPMLSAPDGKQFFMAFTDWTELKKWKDEDGQQTFAFRFKDYADMLLKKTPDGKENPASGFLINPYGAKMMITKEVAASLIARIVHQARKQGGPGAEGQPVSHEKN